jgi:hypothetical protein
VIRGFVAGTVLGAIALAAIAGLVYYKVRQLQVRESSSDHSVHETREVDIGQIGEQLGYENINIFC